MARGQIRPQRAVRRSAVLTFVANRTEAILSRKIVAWSVDTIESDTVARRLIGRACGREGIDPTTLTLHSDRGAQMTENTIAELLEDLGVFAPRRTRLSLHVVAYTVCSVAKLTVTTTSPFIRVRDRREWPVGRASPTD